MVEQGAPRGCFVVLVGFREGSGVAIVSRSMSCSWGASVVGAIHQLQDPTWQAGRFATPQLVKDGGCTDMAFRDVRTGGAVKRGWEPECPGDRFSRVRKSQMETGECMFSREALKPQGIRDQSIWVADSSSP